MNKEEINEFRQSVDVVFKAYTGNVFEGVKMATFAFGMGINFEADDLIDVCVPYIEKVLGNEINKGVCKRLEVNRNSAGVVGMLLAYEIEEHAMACLVIMDDGRAFLLEEATHKPYIFVRENGNPLVTFASDPENGGFKPEKENGGTIEIRGLFDGKHYIISEKMTSCLPSKIDLEITGNDYKSIYYTCTKDHLVLDGQTIEPCEFKSCTGNESILIPQANYTKK